MAVQHQLAIVAPEKSERAADHPAVAERSGHVAAGVPKGAQQLDADERGHRSPHLIEQHDEATKVGRRVDDPDLDVPTVVVLFSHPSPPATALGDHHVAPSARRYNRRIANA